MKMAIMQYSQIFKNDHMFTIKPKFTLLTRFRLDIASFFNNPIYFLPARILLVLLGASLLLLGVFFRKLPPVVPLYYSLPWGEEQLAKTNELFLIPLSIVILFLLNILLSIVFLKKDNFLVQLLLWSLATFTLFGLITLIKIVFLVI